MFFFPTTGKNEMNLKGKLCKPALYRVTVKLSSQYGRPTNLLILKKIIYVFLKNVKLFL